MFRLAQLIGVSALVSSCSVEHIDVRDATVADELQLATPTLPVPPMSDYLDPQVGYEAQVPLGWRRVLADQREGSSFSVTFESPPSYDTDRFADYLMIEIIPGYSEAVFPEHADERTPMMVDGQRVFRERYVLDDYPVHNTRMDLVAWQIRLERSGYSVMMYTVGESREDARLERILIEFAHSFSLPYAPYRVSRNLYPGDLRPLPAA